jgi:hypothetical protein
MRASNLRVTKNTRLPNNDEGERLFALYEASSAKEIATTYQLLYPRRILPHETYIQLVSDLRAIRAECNDNRLAIAAHHRKTSGLATLQRSPSPHLSAHFHHGEPAVACAQGRHTDGSLLPTT